MVRKRKIVEDDEEENLKERKLASKQSSSKTVINVEDEDARESKSKHYKTRSSKKSKQAIPTYSQPDSFELYFDTSILDKEDGDDSSSKKSKKQSKKKKQEEIEEEEYNFEEKKSKKKKSSHMTLSKKQKLNFYSQSSADAEYDNTETASQSDSQTFSTSLSQTDIPRSKPLKEEQLWIHKYSPTNESELPCSSKKLSELKNWLKKAFDKNSTATTTDATFRTREKTLLLFGPPGCTKYSSLKVLTHKMKITLIEYEDPLQDSFYKYEDATEKEFFNGIATKNNLDHLREFFYKTLRYNTVFGSPSDEKKIILIKNLPFCASKSMREMRDSILYEYCIKFDVMNRCPIIILHTVHHSPHSFSNLISNFSGEILHATTQIEMKSISDTEMTKVLRNVLSKEKLHKISETELQSILHNSNGDLRQALYQLQFRSMKKGSKKPSHQQFSTSSQPIHVKNLDGQETTLVTTKNVLDDEFHETDLENQTKHKDFYFDIFHTTGKILYSKRDTDGNLEFNLFKLSSYVHCREEALVAYVHHNALNFLDDLEELEKVGDAFSQSDLFFSHFHTNSETMSAFHSYGYNFACGAAIVHNHHHTSRKFQPLYAPTSTKVDFARREHCKTARELFGLGVDSSTKFGAQKQQFVNLQCIVEDLLPMVKQIDLYRTRRRLPTVVTLPQKSFFNAMPKIQLRSMGMYQSKFKDVKELVEEVQQEEEEEIPHIASLTEENAEEHRVSGSAMVIDEDVEIDEFE